MEQAHSVMGAEIFAKAVMPIALYATALILYLHRTSPLMQIGANMQRVNGRANQDFLVANVSSVPHIAPA